MPRRHRAEAAAARAAFRALAALPPAASARLGSTLGALAGSVFGVRRELVEAQISSAFPERDRDWVRRTAAGCYRHFGREAAEIVRLNTGGTADLPDRLVNREDALRKLEEAIPRGVGGLIVTGHVGNWEAAGAIIAALGVPLAAVVKRQTNAEFDRFLLESRRAIGIEPVYMEEARSRIPGLLARGVSVALVADQDARDRGLFVSFLGRPASTFRGPARLALECGAPLMFGAAVREAEGFRAIVETIDTEVSGPEAELVVTQAWVRRLEACVRAWPEQYFWFHRRWKTPRRNGEGTPLVETGVRDAGSGRSDPRNREENGAP